MNRFKNNWSLDQSPWQKNENHIFFSVNDVNIVNPSIFYALTGEFIGEDSSNDGGIYVVLGWHDDNNTRQDLTEEIFQFYKDLVNSPSLGSTTPKVFKLDISLDDFLFVSGVINKEASGKRKEEVLGIAHAVKNKSSISGRSLRKQVEHYSTVSVKDKISKTSNGEDSVGARAAVIDILLDRPDVVHGATHWDGSDFLLWGLKSPVSNKPHNKFLEYGTIYIRKDLLNRFRNNLITRYPTGKVYYSKYNQYFDIPADVFLDASNFNELGDFVYTYDVDDTDYLEATEVIGYTIFGKPYEEHFIFVFFIVIACQNRPVNSHFEQTKNDDINIKTQKYWDTLTKINSPSDFADIDTLIIDSFTFVSLERGCKVFNDSCYTGLFLISYKHERDTIQDIVLSSWEGKTLKYLGMNDESGKLSLNYLQGTADRCEVSFIFECSNGFLLKEITFNCLTGETPIFKHNLQDLKISLFDLNLQLLTDSLYPIF